MSLHALPTGETARRHAAAAQMREIADAIERGEVTGVVGILDRPSGDYATFQTRGTNRHERIGILVEALFDLARQ